jgi:hypothetical protein
VEASRKHGPFDMRRPRACKDSSGAEPSVALGAEEMAEALDWDAFSARHFPERLRQDSQARSAFAAYRQGREWRAGPPGLRLVPTAHAVAADEPEPHEAGTRRLLAALVAIKPNGSK